MNTATNGSARCEGMTPPSSSGKRGWRLAAREGSAAAEEFDISESIAGVEADGTADVISLEITGFHGSIDYWRASMSLKELV